MRSLSVLAWLLFCSASVVGAEHPWTWKTTETRWQWTVTERPAVQPVVVQPVYWSHPVEARPTMPMRWSGFSRAGC